MKEYRARISRMTTEWGWININGESIEDAKRKASELLQEDSSDIEWDTAKPPDKDYYVEFARLHESEKGEEV